MEQDPVEMTAEEEKMFNDEIKANGKWQDEKQALDRLDNLYKYLVSASPGDLVQQFNQLYLLAQQIFQENLELKKKVNKVTAMYLRSEMRAQGFLNPMIYNFRKQFQG